MAYVYIMTNRKDGTLYIGVTSDLTKRVWEHKHAVVQGFTSKYKLHRLVYVEVLDDIVTAIAREKQLKKFYRFQKIALIERMNPGWEDLYETLVCA